MDAKYLFTYKKLVEIEQPFEVIRVDPTFNEGCLLILTSDDELGMKIATKQHQQLKQIVVVDRSSQAHLDEEMESAHESLANIYSSLEHPWEYVIPMTHHVIYHWNMIPKLFNFHRHVGMNLSVIQKRPCRVPCADIVVIDDIDPSSYRIIYERFVQCLCGFHHFRGLCKIMRKHQNVLIIWPKKEPGIFYANKQEIRLSE